MSSVIPHLFPTCSPGLSTVEKEGTPPIIRKWGKQLNNKCWNARRSSSSCGTMTMAVLASYLLIFTVVISFVTSQPVTNLRLPNKLNIRATVEQGGESSSSLAGNSTDGGNGATIPTTIFTFTPHPDYKPESDPLGIPTGMEAHQNENKQEGEELNQLVSVGNEKEHGVGYSGDVASVSTASNNDNDDVLPMTMRNINTWSTTTTISIPAFPSSRRKIRNEMEEGGKEGKEMGRDKDKVMVTDDVRGSSSRIVNPSSPSSVSTRGNDNSEESPQLPSPSSRRESNSMENDIKDDVDDDEESANSDSSKINITRSKSPSPSEMNLAGIGSRNNIALKSRQIMSDTKQPVTAQQKHGHTGDANVVNNHANLGSGDGGFHADNTEAERNSKSSPSREDKDDSPTSKRATSVTKMNTSPLPSKRKAKGDDGGEDDDDDDGSDINNQEYFYDSPPALVNSLEEKDNYGKTSSPSSSQSPGLMNKWIKTLVKLSQCRANCFQVEKEMSTTALLGDFQGDRKRKERDEENTNFGGAQSNSLKPSLVFTPTAWSFGVDGGGRIIPSEQLGSGSVMQAISKAREKVRKNKTRKTPLLPTTTPPGGAIKVTWGKSMKYHHELSNCQKSCQAKFPISKTFRLVREGGAEAVISAGESEAILDGEERSGNPNGTISPDDYNKGNENNGGNNNSNENIKTKPVPSAAVMERLDEEGKSDWESGGNDDHYYSLPYEKGEKQRQRKNQLPSALLKENEESKFVKSAGMMMTAVPGATGKETKRNKGIIPIGPSKSLMESLEIEEVKKYSTQSSISTTGSIHNLKTVPSEPQLTLRQLSLSSPVFLLSWPKPSNNPVSGNNNNRPDEASVSTQVEDKKGIVLKKDDDVDKAEKNGKKSQQQKKMNSSSEFSYAQPVAFVYSIILEESWGKIRSDGTADIYARRWKLIDQTMARTTTQIVLPIQVHGSENRSGNEKGRKLNLRASGAVIQEEKERMKRAEKQNSSPRMMIEQREDDHDDEETKRSSSVFSSISSKVTVRVLAVNGQQGLVKVYSAKLNNSYYHLKGLDDQAIARQPHPPNPNQLSSSYLIPSEQNLNQPGDSPNLNFHPFNETTGSQSKEKPKTKKGSISGKKVGEKNIPANLDNDNSNQILILPSKESLSGSRTRLGEKLMMTRIKQKNTNSVNDDDEEYRNQENSIKGWGSSATSFIKTEENPNLLPLPTGEKTQNWRLRMVSQVYQKFLVVTQITWNYPGSDYLQDDMTLSTHKIPGRDSGELLTRTDMFGAPSPPQSSSSSSPTESSNSLSGNGSTQFESSTLSPKNNAEEEENESRKKMAHSSSLSNEKWAGCGTDGRENTVEGDGGSGGGSKLTFLLSWEIFGGGLRGNLVTDTCSASISLWPDTAYIIQVGLITPHAKDRSNYSSSDNETSTSSSPPSSTVTETTSSAAEYDGHEHDIDDIDEISSDWKWREENRKRTVGSSSTGRKMPLVTAPEEDNADGNDKRQQEFLPQSSSSSDPLLLPESITFPFDGEPKVTIKSERILVNTTRANFIPDGHGSSSTTIRRLSNDHDHDDARDGNDDTASSPIHNQDKMTRGNPKSNNNSEKVVGLGVASLYYFKRGNVGGEPRNFDENEDSPPERDFTSRNSKNGNVVVVRGGSGISDKLDVSEIIIGRNGKEDDDGYQHDHVFRANDQRATSAENDSESQAWEDDEDEATDQDESLFARSLAHQHHHQHHGQRESDGPSFPEVSKSPSPIKFDDRDEMNSKKGVDSDSQLSDGVSGNKHNNFLTMNRFYQSLYGISPNNLDLSNRYPNVIKISNNGGGGGGEGGSRHDNVNINNSSARKQKTHSNLIDAKTIPLLLGEYTQYSSNGTKFIFPSEGNETLDEASGVRGKLYTLFVILVISFVVFLFIVAVVGFCVLTSSIKENYKYFVPKKVRVWTTVGQLLKGSGGSSADGEDNEGDGGGLRGFRDSAEGSFYPRRLREEADDDELEEDEEFDPDEEVTTSVPPSDDEDNSPGEDNECCCVCDCVMERNYLDERDKNSFSLSERRTSVTSETANLIRDGEEASVELIAPCDSSSNGEVGVGCHYHHHPACGSDGNCDNNNPCYHTMPGVSANAEAEVQLHHHPHSSLSSPEEERTSTFSSTNFCRASTSNKSYSHGHPPQRQHCTHHRHHKHKRNSSDVRIDVMSSSNRSKGQPNPRLQGYY